MLYLIFVRPLTNFQNSPKTSIVILIFRRMNNIMVSGLATLVNVRVSGEMENWQKFPGFFCTRQKNAPKMWKIMETTTKTKIVHKSAERVTKCSYL